MLDRWFRSAWPRSWPRIAGFPSRRSAGSVTYKIKVDTTRPDAGVGRHISFASQPLTPQPPRTDRPCRKVFNPITDGTLGTASTVDGNATGDLTTPMGVTANNSTCDDNSDQRLNQTFTVASFFDVFVTLLRFRIGPGATGNYSGTSSNSPSSTRQVNSPFNDGQPVSTPTASVRISHNRPQVQKISSRDPQPSRAALLGLGLGSGRRSHPIPQAASGRLIVNPRRHRAGRHRRCPGR